MHKPYTFTQRIERGSVLAITLMLLVILALLGTFAIRNSTQSERVMNGIRTSNVSEHAAETALRFCEKLAQQDDQTGEFGTYKTKDYIDQDKSNAISKVADGSWNQKNSWGSGNARLLSLPTDYHDATHAPQCIIERIDTGQATGFVITARGFGDDAVIQQTTGEVTSGAETWLQSTLTQAK